MATGGASDRGLDGELPFPAVSQGQGVLGSDPRSTVKSLDGHEIVNAIVWEHFETPLDLRRGNVTVLNIYYPHAVAKIRHMLLP